MTILNFNSDDLLLLYRLNDYYLYLLNVALIEAACIAKNNWPSRSEAYQTVALAETAAKEVTCRKRFSPKSSNSKYAINGITYDTLEYRNWIKEFRQKCTNITYSNNPFVTDTFTLLERFSFGDSILSIKRTV